jgi:hypothetical protein
MRTIREEGRFREQLEELGVSARRLDELMEGIALAVSLRPEVFPRVPGTSLHRIKVRPFQGLPHLNLWFWYNETTVSFVEVDLMD